MSDRDPVATYRLLVELCATGYRDQEIADQLGVTARTVRRWRKAGQIVAGSVQVPAPVRHGTTTGYRQGCRLACCVNAANSTQAARRRRHQQATAARAINAYKPWTPAEDVLAFRMPALAAADQLGRTLLAVQSRRARLLEQLERTERPTGTTTR